MIPRRLNVVPPSVLDFEVSDPMRKAAGLFLLFVGLLAAAGSLVSIDMSSRAQQRLDWLTPLAFENYGRMDELMGERVLNPPNDRLLYATMVFTSDDWKRNQAEREVLAWFDANPELASLKTTTHFFHYKASDPMYQQRFKAKVGSNFPIIVFQDYAGVVHYQAAGAQIPSTSRSLVAQMATSAQLVRDSRRLNGDCGPCTPLDDVDSVPFSPSGDLFPDALRRIVQRKTEGLLGLEEGWQTAVFAIGAALLFFLVCVVLAARR